VERLQRREDLRAELEEPLRRAQVLEPVLPQVAHLDAGEIRRRLREQHLAAVPGGGDPRRAVHVEADVALDIFHRLARVEAHPHAHGPVRQRELRVGRGRHRIGCPREGNEERIARRLDFDSAMPRPHPPQHTVVLRKHACITVAELLQQVRRALDVSKEERDRPGRKLWPHAVILARRALLDHPRENILIGRRAASTQVFHMLLVAATVLDVPWALLQSVEKRLRRRSGLSAWRWLIGARGLRLWKKLCGIPEVDMESFDLFNEHQDRGGGRGHLFARIARQAVTPTLERLELLLIEG
jgi:hypothetical protein